MKKKLLSLFALLCLILPACIGLVGCESSNADAKILATACEQVVQTIYSTSSTESTAVATSSTLAEEQFVGDSTSGLLFEETEDPSSLSSTSAMVYFMSKVYANDAVTTLAKPINFDANYEVNGETLQTNDITLYGKLDKANGKITSQLIGNGNDRTSGRSYNIFVFADINYDFEKEEVTGFEVYVGNGENGEIQYCAKYDGTKIMWTYKLLNSEYTLTDEEESEKVTLNTYTTTTFNSFKELCGTNNANVNVLKKDFSTEYTESMNYINEKNANS